MSERDDEISETTSSSPSPSSSCCFILAPRILLESLQIIFSRNKHIFLSIFTAFTFPLSALLFAASLSTYRLRRIVTHLESLSRLAATRFEARQVSKESRENAVSILYSKSIFALPCLALSLLAAVTSVTSAVTAKRGQTPSLRSAVNAVRQGWKRPLVTSILVHAILLAYGQVPKTLAAMFPQPVPRLAILTVGSALEIYLMAVMSLAIVVSVTEERFGIDAIRVGSEIMEGRRVSGWVLSGFFAVVTGMITEELERAIDGSDLFETTPGDGRSRSTAVTVERVVMSIGDRFWLVVLYGFLVIWSYVVFSVFYLECSRRKRLQSRSETEMTVSV